MPIDTKDLLRFRSVAGSGGGGGADPVVESLSVTANGTYTAPTGVDGYSPVTVNVPQPSGTKTITTNGTHDVTDYETAQVNVPDIPAVTESLTVTENGTYTPASGVDGFDSVTVNVPQPSGTKTITTNGAHDVTDYETAQVNVPQPSGTKTITTNGTHDVTDYETAQVNVPDIPAVTESLTVTENGTYTPDSGVDGFDSVTVNVNAGEIDFSPFYGIVWGEITPAENMTEFQFEGFSYRKWHIYISILNRNGVTFSDGGIRTCCANGRGWISSLADIEGDTSLISNAAIEGASGFTFNNCFLQAGVTYVYVCIRVVQ